MVVITGRVVVVERIVGMEVTTTGGRSVGEAVGAVGIYGGSYGLLVVVLTVTVVGSGVGAVGMLGNPAGGLNVVGIATEVDEGARIIGGSDGVCPHLTKEAQLHTIEIGSKRVPYAQR